MSTTATSTAHFVRRLATCRASTCARRSSTRATCGNRTIRACGASGLASAPSSIGIGPAVCRTSGRPRNCRCLWRARLKPTPHGTRRSSFTPASRIGPGRRACRCRAPLLHGCRCGRHIREARASSYSPPAGVAPFLGNTHITSSRRIDRSSRRRLRASSSPASLSPFSSSLAPPYISGSTANMRRSLADRSATVRARTPGWARG